MMSPVEIAALRQQLVKSGERRLIWLEGSEETCIEQALPLLGQQVFWLGQGPSQYQPLPAHKALTRLGQACDSLVINAFSGFHPDAFGALAGTLQAGGLLLLLTPPSALWPTWPDPDRARLVAGPDELARVAPHFLARIVRLLTADPALDYLSLTRLPLAQTAPWCIARDEADLTIEQARTLPALHKVLYGHRRRPLVLSADRGRGKSALLGIAAKQFIAVNPTLSIIVTAPSQATVATLLQHANQPSHSKQLRYCAPDRVAQGLELADLLLVDEAAAIPTGLLEQMLKHYSRIIFATTEHGYEGSGRGFHLRFKKILDKQTPDWQERSLREPIRWHVNDPLEPLIFKLLGLNCQVSQPTLADQPRWRQLPQAELADNEALLQQIFGLLVLAHYQTTPTDLRLLLEAPDLDIHLLEQDGFANTPEGLLGVALVVREGPLAGELAEAIWSGSRRPRGHLLPQSLLAHAGFKEAADFRYARVMRIAIHPAYQHRQLGSQLLQALMHCYQQQGFDFIGSSFAASPPLLSFWSQQGFRVLRVGLQRDTASGSHSMLLLKALQPQASDVLETWQARFIVQLPSLLAGPLRELEAPLIWQCLCNAKPEAARLSQYEQDELTCFAHHHKPFELCQGVLQRWLLGQHAGLSLLTQDQRSLLLAAVWQSPDWCELAQRMGLAGKPALVKALRVSVATLLAQ